MKNLITLIAIFLFSLRGAAQVLPVTILEVSPEVACAGDSSEAHFIFTSPPPSPPQQFSIALEFKHSPVFITNDLFWGTVNDLAIFDTIGPDIVYSYKFQIPQQCPVGAWTVNGEINSPDEQADLIVEDCSENPLQEVFIYSVDNRTVCIGDSLTVNYKLAPSGTNDQIYLNQPGVITRIWQFSFSFLASQPSTVINGETIYTIKLYITPAFTPGIASLFTPNGTIIIPIYLIDCVTGIENYYSEDSHNTPVKYYDMMGNEIEKRFGEIIIEKRPYQKGKWVRFDKL